MKVAIDMDEVMTNMLPALRQHYKRTRRCPSKIRSIQQRKYIYKDIFNISEKESKWLVYSFWNSPEAASMEPMKGSQKVLKKLKDEGYSLTVVTGRQRYAKKCTETFIEKYYPGVFDDVILTNSYSLCGEPVKKEKVCEAIGADFIIDDTEYKEIRDTIPLQYIGDPEDCVKMYGTDIYPWCMDSKSSIKFKDWNSIEEFFIEGIVPPLRVDFLG